jgi:hypothetical protein
MNTTGTATKFADCQSTTSSTENIDIMAAIEELLGCGGWCDLSNAAELNPAKTYYYRFRDINECSDSGSPYLT